MPTTPAPGPAGATRPPLRTLLLPVAIIAVAAIVTPVREFQLHQSDVALYHDKARALSAGLVPYRDFPLEYPPLAIVPMAVPYALWPFGASSVQAYSWLFAAWQAFLMVGLGLVLARLVRLGADGVDATTDGLAVAGMADVPGEPEVHGGAAPSLSQRLGGAATRLAILSLGAALAITWRFDLFPALLVMASLLAALTDRPWMAGAALGIGILAKLFPIAVAPALAIPWLFPLDLRGLSRYGVAVMVTVALGFLPFALLAGGDSLQFLAYHSDRGLQLESIGGGLAVLGGLLSGQPLRMTFDFSSPQVEGPFAEAWLRLLPAMTIAGFGALGWLSSRRLRRESAVEGRIRPETVVLLVFASVLVLLATSKVFSMQYVVWYLPFVALLRGRRFWLAATVVALTMPIHPLLYGLIVGQEALPVLVLAVRNALFLVLLGVVLRDVARGGTRRRAVPAAVT